MTMTILYLNSCRRQRLRDAFSMNLEILGHERVAHLVDALINAYQHHNSPRTNYNYSMHALKYVVGIQGLAAICLIKEAWNVGSLRPRGDAEPTRQEPANIITHPSTTRPQ